MTPRSASAAAVRELFVSHFGNEPIAVVSAPGRVNLIGEHTDYNGGEVLPIAIERRTYVAVGRAATGVTSRAVSAREVSPVSFDHRRVTRTGGWADYVAGVAAEFERMGIGLSPFVLAVASDLPVGAGLSSSAALEVAGAGALLALAGRDLPGRDLATLAHRAENHFVGVASGIMDQFAAALAREGHALHLWCDTAAFEHVPTSDAVLVFDTGLERSLRSSAFNQRRAECEQALDLLRRAYPDLPSLAAATPGQVRDAQLPEPLNRRALHVVEETRRVGEAVHALMSTGSLPGALLLASHESLRTKYECSLPQLDWFVDRVMHCSSVRGARLTGAGWGGCAIAVGSVEALAAALPRLEQEYRSTFGRASTGWVTQAADGMRTEDYG